MVTYLQDPQLSYDNREVKSKRHDFIPRPHDYDSGISRNLNKLNACKSAFNRSNTLNMHKPVSLYQLN